MRNEVLLWYVYGHGREEEEEEVREHIRFMICDEQMELYVGSNVQQII